MPRGAHLSMAIDKEQEGPGPEAADIQEPEAMETIRQLRGLGVDADVDLPRICVIGKQSSGKSSVMEALTGIEVPRAAGTCTRCAFEIYTASSAVDFECTVSVRCAEQPRLVLAESQEKSEVAEMLRLAQELLLNSAGLEKYQRKLQKQRAKQGKQGPLTLESLRCAAHPENYEDDEDGRRPFTTDVVQVDIKGKGFKDLQLIDLPGLIASGGEELVELIRDLCCEYLKRENTLIAMCCPFDDDLENQEVRSLAKRYDPDGLRTVGILTKPDKIPEGLEAQRRSLLRNPEGPYRLRHGYFAVKNPAQPAIQRGITAREARAEEADFFGKWQDALDRCGTESLREFLGEQLHRLIVEQLWAQLNTAACEVADPCQTCLVGYSPEKKLSRSRCIPKPQQSLREELQAMGSVVKPEQAMTHLDRLVDSIKIRLDSLVEAKDRSELSLWKGVEKGYLDLREACYACRPVFHVCETPLDDSDLTDTARKVELRSWRDWQALTRHMNHRRILDKGIHVGSFRLCEGDRVVGPLWSKLPGSTGEPRCRLNQKSAAPGWQDGWEAEPTESVDSATGARKSVTVYRTYRWRPAELLKENPRWPVAVFVQSPLDRSAITTLEDLRKRIEDKRGRELRLPGGPASYAAAQEVIGKAIEKWRVPAERCISDASHKLEAAICNVVSEVTMPYSKLFETVKASLLAALSEAFADCKRGTEKLLQQEQSPDLFTQNDHYLQDSFHKARRMVKRLLGLEVDFDELEPEKQTQLRQLLRESGLQWCADVSEPSQDDDAIWSLCMAHAYHKVAFKRFCDQLPREVDHMLLRPVVRKIKDSIWNSLQDAIQAGNVHHFFLEDQRTLEKRKQLEDKARPCCKCRAVLGARMWGLGGPQTFILDVSVCRWVQQNPAVVKASHILHRRT
ncbi:MX2 [Symbiodinium necroappetens]|uniref:MX2 protein n=1 Tax=Symbiodinium necroappetens TaxID=1628268 RepID=A0A812XU36_9DINO|nr:MX2 [Symbiodinium necroappetens]